MDAKYYKQHIKKPILEKVRTCELPSCEVTFEPNRADQKYCCRKHTELHWHIKNKRVYKRDLPPTEKPYQICGKDSMRRDKPSLWLKYMRNNPCYASALGRVNINSLGI
jgi:hypothetical protein